MTYPPQGPLNSTIIELNTRNISSTIHIPSNTHVRVEGILTRTVDVPIFAVDAGVGTDFSNYNIMIEGNGVLDGGGFPSDMVQIYNCKNSMFRDIRLQNFTGNGFYITGRPTAAYKSYYNTFSNLNFGNLPAGAFAASKAFIKLAIHAIDNFIIGCWGSGVNVTSNYPDGIYVTSGGLHVIGTHFDAINSFLNGDSTNQKEQLTLIGNYIDKPKSHGLKIPGYTKFTRIIGNFFNTVPTNADLIFLDNATNNTDETTIIGNHSSPYTGGAHLYCVEGGDETKSAHMILQGNDWNTGVSGFYYKIRSDYIYPPDQLYMPYNYLTGDYGAAWASWPPAGLTGKNGIIYIVYNSNGGALNSRLYAYTNNAWKMVAVA
jgi:hypothetical protein